MHEYQREREREREDIISVQFILDFFKYINISNINDNLPLVCHAFKNR